MARDKEFRLQMPREKWLLVHGALMDAYTFCSWEERECKVCREWKEIAQQIEKRIPRSMMVVPVATWRKDVRDR